MNKFKDPVFIKEYRKRWYANCKESRIKQIRAREDSISKWYRSYKKTLSCSKCPESDWRCLDFHHRDSTLKILNISVMVNTGASIETIKKEISKCDVLCANCHRKITLQSL